MLSVALGMQKSLSMLVVKHKQLQRLCISDEEWHLLMLLGKFLFIFKKLSTSLCGDHHAILPSVVTGINILIDSIEDLSHNLDKKPARINVDELVISAFEIGRVNYEKITKRQIGFIVPY